MVILIGGVSCSGKTLMAQKLMEKYKIPYVSIDHIKMGLIRGSKYCDFSVTDPDEELSYKLWPIVKGIIMTNIENGQHIIIEGCYLPPEHIRDFEPGYLKHIIPLYIGFSKNYLEKHFDYILRYGRVIERKELDAPYVNRDNFIRLHSRLKELCQVNHMNFFEIDEDYEEEIKEVYRWIDEQVVLTGFDNHASMNNL